MLRRRKIRDHPRSQYRCSFCGKSQEQVRRLIAGPGGVYICDECVGLCNEIMDQEDALTTPDAPTAAYLLSLPEKPCAVCGEKVEQSQRCAVSVTSLGFERSGQVIAEWICHEECARAAAPTGVDFEESEPNA